MTLYEAWLRKLSAVLREQSTQFDTRQILRILDKPRPPLCVIKDVKRSESLDEGCFRFQSKTQISSGANLNEGVLVKNTTRQNMLLGAGLLSAGILVGIA
jgi:hypothetical protein